MILESNIQRKEGGENPDKGDIICLIEKKEKFTPEHPPTTHYPSFEICVTLILLHNVIIYLVWSASSH